MALQVWLPLNGNLKNQGLENIGFINNTGFIVDNLGKIGKCYLTNGKRLDFNILNLATSSWSLAAWFYPTSSSSSGHQYIISLNTSTANDFTGALCFYSNKICARIGGTTYQGDSIALNTWHHGVITYDYETKILKIYHNGNLVLTQNNPVTPITATKVFIGVRGDGTVGTFAGKLNDIRIYNHCLSIKEVKELSKGLILHYTFEGLFNNTLIEYDCSGYQYNGNINGIITQQNNTSRYDYSNKLFTTTNITININPSFIAEGSCSFWAKINNKGSSGWVVFTGDTTSYYLIASTPSKDFYNSNVNGTIKWYIDGTEALRPTFDNNWHYYCVTGINLSTWTVLKINNYSTAYNCDINYSDLRIYATILSIDDITALYKDAGYIDKNKNIYAYEYIEKANITPNLNKKGVFTISKNIIEDNSREPSIDKENIYTPEEFYEI